MSRRRSQGDTATVHAPSVPSDDIPTLATEAQEAVFLGWQKTLSGDICFPLYTILRIDHPLYRSTVTEKTLRAQHLRIPYTPTPHPGVAPSPWHHLGTELANPETARDAIAAAGLDYTVVVKSMKEFVERDHADDVPDRWVTVRTDTGQILGIVEDGYEPIQNRDAFAFFDSLVDIDEAMYETAGTIGRGERIWILAKLPGFTKVQGKDIVNRYLLLSNSHDGSSLVRVKLTPIRVVCNNTLTAALKGAGEVQIRHTLNASDDFTQALSLLGLANSLFGHLDAVFNRMALTKISDEQLLNYVKALIPDDGEDNAKSQGIRNAFFELYESGQGADLSRGTLWGAFNCVTEYTDHKMEGNPAARLRSIWFGRGEQLKLKAYQLAERMI